MKRAPKELVDARVQDLLRIILDGAEEGWDLCEFVREREAEEGSPWHLAEGEKPLSYSQIRRYAARAERLIAESCRASRKRLLRRHLARRRNLYAKACLQGDVRAALACLDSEADLLGLFAPKKIAPTNPKGDLPYAGLTDEELDRRIALAQGRLGGAPGREGPPPGGGGPVARPAGPPDPGPPQPG
jgi:hypothetical protein